MDKADDLPSHGTVFPVRGQYSEGSRAYCLWSILCRSSSRLLRLCFIVCGMAPLAIEQRVLDCGIGVVELDVGEIARRDILQRSQHLNLIFRTGKNVKGGHST